MYRFILIKKRVVNVIGYLRSCELFNSFGNAVNHFFLSFTGEVLEFGIDCLLVTLEERADEVIVAFHGEIREWVKEQERNCDTENHIEKFVEE